MKLDPQVFQRLADECLKKVAAWLETFDPDEVDFQESDGVVTLIFPDGARFVLNRQGAASQMWFAAAARAWHFDWDAPGGCWRDDKDRYDLYERISDAVSEKISRPVRLPTSKPNAELR